MTKLEQKLLELGYEEWRYSFEHVTYIKTYNDKVDLNIDIDNAKTKITNWYLYVEEITIKQQSYIDGIQQAFNQLQNDLEELKECK